MQSLDLKRFQPVAGERKPQQPSPEVQRSSALPIPQPDSRPCAQRRRTFVDIRAGRRRPIRRVRLPRSRLDRSRAPARIPLMIQIPTAIPPSAGAHRQVAQIRQRPRLRVFFAPRMLSGKAYAVGS